MLPFKLIYHAGYDLNLGGHVFPSQKYRLVRERLLAEEFAELQDFIEPEPATEEDLLLVHERGWITRLREGTLDRSELAMLEIPYSKRMAEAVVLAAGGAIHDVAVAIRRMQKDGLIERAMVVDTDVHHGNGTAVIFDGDASVFTLSI